MLVKEATGKYQLSLGEQCGTDIALIVTVFHNCDVIMDTMVSQVSNLTIVYSIVHSGADQRKRQSSASLAFVWWKMFPFDDVIMWHTDISDNFPVFHINYSVLV